ncbi:MAG: MBL fold metallo-hydrolase [Clostridiales bacterium]|nr:MAG: MBL fold metallo-hydrolase [Clostridiales bacterium]
MKTERLVLGALDTNCYIFTTKNTKNAVLIDPAADGDTIISKN